GTKSSRLTAYINFGSNFFLPNILFSLCFISPFLSQLFCHFFCSATDSCRQAGQTSSIIHYGLPGYVINYFQPLIFYF
ncbi:MAG: hypothetical protein NTX22_11670, partial [Ignavibacteriales bacterium]|nr:hypothetical protein [Ignavibacteriales bacterium]